MARLIDGKKMAELLGISYFTLMSWAEKSFIPSYKIGKCRRFDPDELIEFIKGGKAKDLLSVYAKKAKEVTHGREGKEA